MPWLGLLISTAHFIVLSGFIMVVFISSSLRLAIRLSALAIPCVLPLQVLFSDVSRMQKTENGKQKTPGALRLRCLRKTLGFADTCRFREN